ncbi:MAG: hypothetical protein M3P26_15470 [Gemmatimonadota bacterium]|nr:hypothetical protein [Gemmatimonadota bacterium]
MKGHGPVPFGREGSQARRRYIATPLGQLYFGAVMGVGVLTEISTPLVFGGMAMAAFLGWPQAITYGAGFGLGRAAALWVGSLVARPGSLHLVAGSYLQAKRYARWPNVLVSVLMLGAILGYRI